MKRLVLCVFIASCLDVADQRALVDLEVGRAASADVTVSVVNGHATVRSVEGRNVHLWANAPTLDIDLDVTSRGRVTLRIENIVSDARLTGDAAITERPRELSTDATFDVDLDGRSQVRLQLTTNDAHDLSPWRFIVFADVQEAIDRVQDVYSLIDVQGARFAVIAGDLTQQGAPEQLARFQTEMKSLSIPAFATLGNHELGTSGDDFHVYFGRGTSSFVFRGVRMTFVDSASATIAPLADEMLTEWLGRPEPIHAAIMHIPPLDPAGIRNGSFASRGEASRLLSRLALGGVDVTFYGHIHSYYAFENAGMDAFISGGGGSIQERFDGIGRHFLNVDVKPTEPSYDVSVVRVDP